MSVKDDVSHLSGFKLDEQPSEETLPAVQVEQEGTTEFETDFQEVRKNLKELVKKGSVSVEDILQIAKASDHPRAFEVAAGFLKQLADINHQIIDLHKKKKDITQVNPDDQAKIIHNTQNNIVFSGSTRDMQKLLKERGAELIHEVEQEMAAQQNAEVVVDVDPQNNND